MPSARDFALRKFTRRKADGTIEEWQQEDVSGVTCKADAVAMIQRTINFWLPQAIQSVHIYHNRPLEEAKQLGVTMFKKNLREMINEPMPKKWLVKVDDFSFPTEDL